MEKIFFNNHNLTHKWMHYIPIYNDIFKNIKPKKIVEIGMDNGGFLEVLHKFFPDADILGIDINSNCKKIKFNTNKIRTLVLPIEKSNNLQNVIDDKVDIIIDDASHNPVKQFENYYNLFDKLNTNGVYIIEDIECSYFNNRKKYPHLKNNILKLIDDLNGWYQNDINANCNTNKYTKNYYKIEFYSGLIVIHKKPFLNSRPICICSGLETKARFPEYIKKYIKDNTSININTSDKELLKKYNEHSIKLFKNFIKNI